MVRLAEDTTRAADPGGRGVAGTTDATRSAGERPFEHAAVEPGPPVESLADRPVGDCPPREHR